MIAVIETTNYLSEEYSFGLFWSAIRFNYDYGEWTPEKAGDFVTIDSAFYPELGDHYATTAARWVAAERAARGIDEDEDEDD